MTMLEERVSSVEGAYEHLATKADVQELRGDMNTAVEVLRGEMNTSAQELSGNMNTAIERLRGDLRTDMETMRGDLRTEMETIRSELTAQMRAAEIRTIKWVAGITIGTSLGTVTAIAALIRLSL